MGLDSDLVGVIIACTAVGFCLCVVVVLVSCVCYRRLENKRRQFEKKVTDMLSWPVYPSHALPAAFTDGGDMMMDQGSRIGGYRPRILSPNTPRTSVTMYNMDSNASSLPRVNKGDSSFIGSSPGHHHNHHHHPNHHHPSSPRRSINNHQFLSSPLYSNGTRANGHVLVPISLAAQHYGMAAPDFYDARATTGSGMMMPIRPYRIGEDYIETEYYPDVLFDSPSKQQHQQKTQTSSDPHPEPASTDVASNQSSSGNSQSHSPPDHRSETENKNKEESETNKNEDETKPSDSESKHSKESTVDKGQDILHGQKEVNISNDSQYKVIKKHHGHVKMPDWMVRDYEEAESSLEVEEEQAATPGGEWVDESEVQQPGMVSVMVGDYTSSDAMPQDPPPSHDHPSDRTKAGMTSWSSTVEESTTSIIQDYSSTNYIKDFTILDYIDPLPPPPPPELSSPPLPLPEIDYNEDDLELPQSPRGGNQTDDTIIPENVDNDNTNNTTNDTADENDEGDVAIQERKAAVLQQIRQKVNESAEQMPPAFTSTPRVVPEVDSVPPPPAPPPPLPGQDFGGSRRQRPENEGSLDDLPPAIGDTRL